MADIVALRIEPELLRRIDKLGKEEIIDRSTVIRKLIHKGYAEHMKENAALLYKEGKITFSEAAHRAGLTLWDMEHFLIDKGIVSDYSIDDLEREAAIIRKNK